MNRYQFTDVPTNEARNGQSIEPEGAEKPMFCFAISPKPPSGRSTSPGTAPQAPHRQHPRHSVDPFLMVHLVVDRLLTLRLLRLQKLLQPNEGIHRHLQFGAHDRLDLFQIALARRLLVLILPRAHEVLVRPDGVLLTLLLELGRLALDQWHALVELAQALVAERVGLGEVRGNDG